MANDRKSLRTPLRRVRYLGSVHEGAEENWRVHVTSVALVPLTFGFVWLVLTLLNKDYNHVRAALGHPLPAILILLFVLVGIYHMQFGLRSIILDYSHGHAREAALMLNIFLSAALALTCVYAVVRIIYP